MPDESKKAEVGTDTPPLQVEDATLRAWSEQARAWAVQAKKVVGNNLPPGFDPDDEREYFFRPGQ
jgi:hypothetical protein